MTKLLSLLCALMLIGAVLTGCVQRAADDVADKASEVVSDIKEDASTYGTVSDNTDGSVGDDATDESPTIVDMDEMIDNGVIDDENDDDYDGDNIDDDARDNSVEEHDDDNADNNDGDYADGDEHNEETMNDNSDFI